VSILSGQGQFTNILGEKEMKIMVFDVPAESGGALNILNQYYYAAVKDTENEWLFVISTPKLKKTKSINILSFPWVKKSWLHRIYFDKFIAKKIVVENNIDEILSLQNVVISGVTIKQTLYLHQPLPFTEKKFNITENFRLWLYQNIVSRMIYDSIQRADKVIVQTQWMKNAILKKVNVSKDKIVIEQPELNLEVKKYYKQENDNYKLFFYPASALKYKNHKVIVEAVHLLVIEGFNNFQVVFTLNGNEDRHIKKLYQIVQEEKLPIRFIGPRGLEDVYNYYSKSVLIFPSYIETFGLPLLEAKMHNSPILASDCAFSHEVLCDYSDVTFFNPFNSVQLSILIKQHICSH